MSNWGIAEMQYSKLLISIRADQGYIFALSRFAEALKIKPDFFEALGNWGICLYFCQSKSDWGIADRRGMLIAAAKALSKCLESCGDTSEAFNYYHHLGLVYFQYALYLKDFSGNMIHPFELPAPFIEMQDTLNIPSMDISASLDAAYKAFQNALKLNPSHILSWLELTKLLMEKVNILASTKEQIDLYLEATKYLDQALSIK